MSRVTDHVRLLAGTKASGQPVYEMVPARRAEGDCWEILGTPAVAEGCATADVVQVAAGGEFTVLRRGGNVGVVSYAQSGQDTSAAADRLRTAVGELGDVAVDPAGRWIVATLPVAVGFDRIERLFGEWRATTGAEWSYVNVYDEQGGPLDWWA